MPVDAAEHIFIPVKNCACIISVEVKAPGAQTLEQRKQAFAKDAAGSEIVL